MTCVPIDDGDISFFPVEESDFEDFRTLRKSVMRPHVDRQGLSWDEAAEDIYHRELFDAVGLRIVKYKGARIGYIGVSHELATNHVVVGRFCFMPQYQGMGIGTATLNKVLEEAICQDKKIILDVLLQNPATRLYERLGFVRISADGKSAYYERNPRVPASPILKNNAMRRDC